MTSQVAQIVKHLSTMRETGVQSLGREDLLEKEMATHSSILAWKIPWMEEPGPGGRKESDTTERLHFHFLSVELKSVCFSASILSETCSKGSRKLHLSVTVSASLLCFLLLFLMLQPFNHFSYPADNFLPHPPAHIDYRSSLHCSRS